MWPACLYHPGVMRIIPLLEQRMRLGESIIWDDKSHVLYWVDVGYPSKIWRFDEARRTANSIPYDGLIGCVALTHIDDTLLVLTSDGLKLCHFPGGQTEHFLDVEPEFPTNICNDCGVDARGRLWFGTMENNLAPDNTDLPIGKKGGLYSLSNKTLTRHESGLGIPNTMLWSPDSRSFYLADSFESTLFRYDYDGETIANKTVFAKSSTAGSPDGSTMDCSGNLWNCRWGDAAIFVFAPSGEIVRTIPVPASQVTSCTFGGPNMTTLYIATARHAMTSAEEARYPLAGTVFKLETGVRGTTRGRVRID